MATQPQPNDPAAGLLSALDGLGFQNLDLSAYLPAAAQEAAAPVAQEYNPRLPPWAQGLAREVTKDPDFDPYMRVFWGGTKTYDFGDQTDVGVDVPKGLQQDEFTYSTETEAPKTVSIQRALDDPYTWSDKEVAESIARFKAAGVPVSSFAELVEQWSGLVSRAAMTFSATKGERALTPWDVLDLQKSEAMAAGTWVDPDRREVSVTRSVSELTEGQSWASIRTALQEMLGRDPSDQELRDFTYRMNRMAAENPRITRTIEQYKNGELESSVERARGGITTSDADMEAYEQAQNDPEYAEYQAATTYFQALTEALGAIGG